MGEREDRADLAAGEKLLKVRAEALAAAGIEAISTFKELKKIVYKKKIDPVKLNAIIHAIKLLGLEPAQQTDLSLSGKVDYTDTELAMRLNRLIEQVSK